MRILFSIIILLHGLIHFMGFLKAYDLATIEQLSLPISKPTGLLWLLACLLFVGGTVAFLVKKEWWWILTAGAVVISQMLIFMYWQDAKFGTIANIIILIGCILGYGAWHFNSMVNSELNSFLPANKVKTSVIRSDSLDALPPVVQRWMNSAGVDERHQQLAVKFKQTGQMKTSPEGSWMPVEADQYVRTDEPGFIWIADVKAAPFIHLAGRDKYVDGKGAMLIKLLSLFPVANSDGPKIDQGAMLRYLAEMVWYPSAALHDYIEWEQMSTTTAKATMRYGEITASGIFEVNDSGLVKSFEAARYYDRKEGATLEDWRITIDESSYQQFEGIRVPTRAEVTWKLAEGDFTWYKLQISGIVFNKISEAE